ncbi:MAG: molybdopterin-dependent oxidoreductase [Candidatus Methanospirareceae archaeon]
MSRNSRIPGWLIIAIVVIGIAAIAGVAAVTYLELFNAPAEQIEWNMTVVGSDGEEKVLTFEEIIAMESHESFGGFFTTVGTIQGPFELKGVPLADICELVGGIDTTNTVWVSAPDGYLMVFTYDQVINGEFRTFDPATFKEVPHEELTIILAFQQDGAPLPDNYGKPLRIAIVSSRDDYITEGHYWVMWVDRIEVRSLPVKLPPSP